MTKYEIYDTIIARCCINLISIARRNNGQIILKDFHPRDFDHKFMFRMASMVSGEYQSENFSIILEMPWYRKIFASKYIRKEKRVRAVQNGIDIKEFLGFSKAGFPDIAYKDIWKEYYAK